MDFELRRLVTIRNPQDSSILNLSAFLVIDTRIVSPNSIKDRATNQIAQELLTRGYVGPDNDWSFLKLSEPAIQYNPNGGPFEDYVMTGTFQLNQATPQLTSEFAIGDTWEDVENRKAMRERKRVRRMKAPWNF